ncbi:MAG: CoA transferase [Pseudorhodoplanes sp.]|nr:CoA transferase [Pseudorhodoplanes sp.]
MNDQKSHHPAKTSFTARPLGDIRVLELGDQVSYAGRLLALQGAEVTLVEPPEGFASRGQPPFLDNIPGSDRSLSFHYFNAGKRSVIIDRTKPEGRECLRAMLLSVDVVLDDRLQLEWQADGIGYPDLRRENPGLIWCAVTGYGQSGPHSHYKSDDFIAMAAGGMMQLAGYGDAGPFAGPGDIAVKSAGAFAAVAVMLALHGRDASGKGQFIDISMQEVVALGTETAPQFFDIKGTVRRRLTRPQRQAGIGYYPCADGYVMLYAAEAGVGTGWTRLTDWLVEAKTPSAEQLQSEDWLTNSYKARPESIELFAKIFGSFSKTQTKQSLFIEGQRRRIAITPVNNGADVCNDPHVKAVGAILAVSACGARPIKGPNVPVMMSATPFEVRSDAPALGESIDRPAYAERLPA